MCMIALGATLPMLLPSVRNFTCVGLTVQDGGTHDLRSRYGEPTDQWSIAVRLGFGSLLSLSLSCLVVSVRASLCRCGLIVLDVFYAAKGNNNNVLHISFVALNASGFF